ncbi:MAG: hypothetical protein A3K76_04935 [Euryarchaeota archaeon RBG_13_57_23]|nr:MAG: hypothetical protein A3K76_04935 [Euryarchaeota archaeon RBG_13_57_23]
MDLVARRADVAGEIGRMKAKDGLRTRDPAREKQIKAAFARNARRLGVNENLATELAVLLINDAVKIQTRNAAKNLRGRSALIVGGSGRMGAWMCRFLSGRGASVTLWDPRGSLPGYRSVKSVRKVASESDLVVIASPLGVAAKELREVLRSSPQGTVFDICSVKDHLAKDIKAAAGRGTRITSVHPMFGPGVASPRGRNVLVCKCGCAGADREIVGLFSSAGAKVTKIGVDGHDELMAYVLGLPHLCTIAFASTAEKSRIPFAELARVQGPSFDRLARSAIELSKESRRVYHDIQLLNPKSKDMISGMEKALAELRFAALARDPEAFRTIIDRCEEYLEVS